MKSPHKHAYVTIKKVCASYWIIKTRFKTWLILKKVHTVIKSEQKRWLDLKLTINV